MLVATKETMSMVDSETGIRQFEVDPHDVVHKLRVTSACVVLGKNELWTGDKNGLVALWRLPGQWRP